MNLPLGNLKIFPYFGGDIDSKEVSEQNLSASLRNLNLYNNGNKYFDTSNPTSETQPFRILYPYDTFASANLHKAYLELDTSVTPNEYHLKFAMRKGSGMIYGYNVEIEPDSDKTGVVMDVNIGEDKPVVGGTLYLKLNILNDSNRLRTATDSTSAFEVLYVNSWTSLSLEERKRCLRIYQASIIPSGEEGDITFAYICNLGVTEGFECIDSSRYKINIDTDGITLYKYYIKAGDTDYTKAGLFLKDYTTDDLSVGLKTEKLTEEILLKTSRARDEEYYAQLILNNRDNANAMAEMRFHNIYGTNKLRDSYIKLDNENIELLNKRTESGTEKTKCGLTISDSTSTLSYESNGSSYTNSSLNLKSDSLILKNIFIPSGGVKYTGQFEVNKDYTRISNQILGSRESRFDMTSSGTVIKTFHIDGYGKEITTTPYTNLEMADNQFLIKHRNTSALGPNEYASFSLGLIDGATINGASMYFAPEIDSTWTTKKSYIQTCEYISKKLPAIMIQNYIASPSVKKLSYENFIDMEFNNSTGVPYIDMRSQKKDNGGESNKSGYTQLLMYPDYAQLKMTSTYENKSPCIQVGGSGVGTGSFSKTYIWFDVSSENNNGEIKIKYQKDSKTKTINLIETLLSVGTTTETANTALTTANAAKTAAATAQTTANTAKTNAATAQTTANTAKTNAATAQTTANAAKTAAATAQTTANTANTKANTAISILGNANTSYPIRDYIIDAVSINTNESISEEGEGSALVKTDTNSGFTAYYRDWRMGMREYWFTDTLGFNWTEIGSLSNGIKVWRGTNTIEIAGLANIVKSFDFILFQTNDLTTIPGRAIWDSSSKKVAFAVYLYQKATPSSTTNYTIMSYIRIHRK